MRLSLIGMSGIGKSYWSEKLVGRGFKRFCCDGLIAKRLGPEFTNGDNVNHIMGAWMGFPFEAHYAASAAKYLALEAEVLAEVITFLETHPAMENVIVDTTGSVIYLEQQLLHQLAAQTQIIYLDAPLAIQEKMRAAYRTNPAPVIWLDQFNKRPDESNEAALVRCYPELLASRSREYRKWADVILDYHLLRQPGFGVDDFLGQIEQILPQQSAP